MTKPLILASTSIYKKMLLERLNISFTCESPNTNEQPLPNEAPKALAIRLAKAKALAVLATNPNAIVIGADQVLSLIHISEPTRLRRISYAVFCLKKKKKKKKKTKTHTTKNEKHILNYK